HIVSASRRDDLSVGTCLRISRFAARHMSRSGIIPVHRYAASFRIEVIATEQGCRAFYVILGHQQNGLLVANRRLASAHVVAQRFAFAERLTDFFARLVLVLSKFASTTTEKPTAIPILSGNTCTTGSPATVWFDFGTKNGSLSFCKKFD